MRKIKGPEDIKRAIHTKVLQRTTSSVTRSRLPPRTVANTHHSHHLKSARVLNRRIKHEWEPRVYEVLRLLEEHRYGRANALYSALDETTRTLDEVARRKAEVETFAEELEAANEEMEAANEEMQASNEELHAITEDLERANTDLEQFALVASHDLKEPLTTITRHAENLIEEYRDALGEDARENIAYIVDETRHMGALIDSVLTYARVNIDTSPFKPVDCNDLLTQAVKALGAGIQQSGAMISHDPLPTISADEVQLSRVFLNIMANAVKYHRPGEAVSIHLSAREEPDEWIISVRDDGIGIDSDYLEDVFKMFVRLHSLKKYPGAGLGLAIAEKIIRRHKGRIWAESAGDNQGTTLHFTIRKGLA